jgi:regulator of sigma E protease
MSIIIFILVLSVLILIHELGHFVMARRAGVWVEEFGFGLPPRVFGKKIGETIYSLNLLPFGGFVRLHGENSEEGVHDPKRAFINQNKRTRTAIIVAGVVMNLVLAIAAFAVTYSISGIPRDTGEVRVVEVAENSPAQQAGIEPGNVILQVEGRPIDNVAGFINAVGDFKGEEITVLLRVNGEESEVVMSPRADPPPGEGAVGVVISSIETHFPPLWQRPFLGVYYGVQEALFWGGMVLMGLFNLFAQLFRGNVPQDIAGPVGIYALTSQAAAFGWLTLINFVGILSINLAILNIFPFPALDGGRLLFIGIEALIGRKVVPKIEAIAHTVGIIILIMLLLAVTANDIRRLIEGGGIAGFIESFTQ